MKVLIVYAHHEQKSFNGALKEKTVQVLKSQGHTVEISDLYAMNFKAVADRDDFSEHLQPDYMNYMLDQQNASIKKSFRKDIVAEQEKVSRADLIIFHFPIWWFSIPAMLKGWFDRVFATGFSWDFGKIYSNGLLKGKRGMLVVTTGGGRDLYQKNGAHGTTIDEVLYGVTHGTLFFCGMDVLPSFVAFSVFQAGEEGRKKYLLEYEEMLKKIENIKPIEYH